MNAQEWIEHLRHAQRLDTAWTTGLNRGVASTDFRQVIKMATTGEVLAGCSPIPAIPVIPARNGYKCFGREKSFRAGRCAFPVQEQEIVFPLLEIKELLAGIAGTREPGRDSRSNLWNLPVMVLFIEKGGFWFGRN